MEIIAQLTQPYTEVEKSDFIVEYNHKQGLEIRETEEELQAWGKTEEEIIAEKEAEFDNQFFETSLGYIRRDVSMKDGSKASFLKDLLPQLVEGIPIFVYLRPDFSQENVNILDYQKTEYVTQTFINECKNRLIIDFYGFNPLLIQGENNDE